MIKSIKKIKILSLSLFIAFAGYIGLSSFIIAKDEKVHKSMSDFNLRISSLTSNKNWIIVSKYWKKLNNLRLHDSNTSNHKQFEDLKAELNTVNKSINNLCASGVLKEEEGTFLFNFISVRLGYLEYEFGLVTCYRMSQLGLQIVKTRSDLEKRFDIVEKLYAENKISTETFDKTKQKIIDDVKFIEESTMGATSENFNNDLVNLIIYLNK